MAKNVQARMDRADLAPLRAWAERVVKADDILSRTIALENGIEALESRRGILSQEVADLLARTEAARQAFVVATAEYNAAIAETERLRKDAQEGLVADRAARAKSADDEARDYKQRNDRLASELRQELDQLRAEGKALRAQRQELQAELEAMARKHGLLR